VGGLFPLQEWTEAKRRNRCWSRPSRGGWEVEGSLHRITPRNQDEGETKGRRGVAALREFGISDSPRADREDAKEKLAGGLAYEGAKIKRFGSGALMIVK